MCKCKMLQAPGVGGRGGRGPRPCYPHPRRGAPRALGAGCRSWGLFAAPAPPDPVDPLVPRVRRCQECSCFSSPRWGSFLPVKKKGKLGQIWMSRARTSAPQGMLCARGGAGGLLPLCDARGTATHCPPVPGTPQPPALGSLEVPRGAVQVRDAGAASPIPAVSLLCWHSPTSLAFPSPRALFPAHSPPSPPVALPLLLIYLAPRGEVSL